MAETNQNDKQIPSLGFTILCDDVRQELGGKLSLMGLFENIYAVKFPVMHARLAIVSEWGEGQGEFALSTRLVSPDRKTVLREISSPLKLGGPQYRHRDVSLHLNVEFPAPGVYWIEHFMDGKMVASIPLRVIQVKEPPTH